MTPISLNILLYIRAWQRILWVHPHSCLLVYHSNLVCILVCRLYIVIGSMTTIVIMTAMLLFGLGVVVSVLRLVFAG